MLVVAGCPKPLRLKGPGLGAVEGVENEEKVFVDWGVPKADGVPAGLFWKNDIKGHEIAHEQNETESALSFTVN